MFEIRHNAQLSMPKCHTLDFIFPHLRLRTFSFGLRILIEKSGTLTFLRIRLKDGVNE